MPKNIIGSPNESCETTLKCLENGNERSGFSQIKQSDSILNFTQPGSKFPGMGRGGRRDGTVAVKDV